MFVKSKDNIDFYAKILNGNRISYVETNSVRNVIQNTVNIIPAVYNVSFGFRDENFVVIGSNSLFSDKQQSKATKLKPAKVLDFVP